MVLFVITLFILVYTIRQHCIYNMARIIFFKRSQRNFGIRTYIFKRVCFYQINYIYIQKSIYYKNFSIEQFFQSKKTQTHSKLKSPINAFSSINSKIYDIVKVDFLMFAWLITMFLRKCVIKQLDVYIRSFSQNLILLDQF